MEVLAYGNGAGLTGAPASLLTLLTNRPAGLRVRLVLIGGGPLLARYEAVTDEVTVIDHPTTRGPTLRRLWEEVALASSTVGRHVPQRVLVNTIEYESTLLRAIAASHKARVIIREQPFYLDGVRGRIRRSLLKRFQTDSLRCVSLDHAEAYSQRLDRSIHYLPNTVIRRRALQPRPERPLTFIAVGQGTHKGIRHAVEAFKRMKYREQARLLVVSTDAPDTAVSGIRWVPAIEELGERIEEYADVALGMSAGEPFGRLPVEAALANLPTIAWNVPGYRSTVPNLDGILVPAFDIAALASEMDRLVLSTPSLDKNRSVQAQTAYGQHAVEQWWRWITADL